MLLASTMPPQLMGMSQLHWKFWGTSCVHDPLGVLPFDPLTDIQLAIADLVLPIMLNCQPTRTKVNKCNKLCLCFHYIDPFVQHSIAKTVLTPPQKSNCIFVVCAWNYRCCGWQSLSRYCSQTWRWHVRRVFEWSARHIFVTVCSTSKLFVGCQSRFSDTWLWYHCKTESTRQELLWLKQIEEFPACWF